MANISTTSQVVFMCVALVPPKVCGTVLCLGFKFLWWALTLVLCEDCPCHDEPSDPGVLVVPSYDGVPVDG
eukprot:6550765-Prorocentrum_lima.AAC.1